MVYILLKVIDLALGQQTLGKALIHKDIFQFNRTSS